MFVEGLSNGPCVGTARVAPEYFRTLHIAMRGQAPDWANTERATAGAVVSASLARRLWPGEDAIGKGIRVNGDGPPYYRVVGVAADVRRDGFDRPLAETVYFPLVSIDGAPLQGAPRGMRILIRTRAGEPAQVIRRIRSVVSSIDSTVPVADVRTLSELVAKSYAPRSFTTWLLAAGAVLALILSAVGLYGVVSYGVATRRSEIGVRLALGARPIAVRTMVIRETLALVTIGLLVGLAFAMGLTQLLAGFLFGVSPHDPAILGGVSGILLSVGLIAGAIPAWRASQLDPVIALRHE